MGNNSPCWGDWNEEESSSGQEDDLTEPLALLENYEEDYSSDEESLLSLEDVEQKEKEDYAVDESFFDYFGEHVNQDVFMVKATATKIISNDKWLGDSGASSHVCNDMKYMGKSNPSDEKVTIGDSSTVKAEARGTAHLKTMEGQAVDLDDTLYIPEFD